MAHTIKVIVGGLMLLALSLLIGRLIAGSAPAIGLANAAKVFIPHSFFHRCVCRASRGGTLRVVVVVAPL